MHVYICICIYTHREICIYNLQLDGNTSPWFPVRAPSTGVTIQKNIGQGLPWSRGHTLMLVLLVLVKGVHSFFEGEEAARKMYIYIYVCVCVCVCVCMYIYI